MHDPSKLIDLAARFRRHSEPFRSLGLKGQADLYAEEGREAWGIWRLIPKNRDAEPAWVTFSLLASLALEEFGILPMPAPQPLEFDPNWGAAEDIPAGLDAVDASTRAWLHLLRRESLRNESLMFEVHSAGGSFPDVWEASAVQCERSAQAKTQEERFNTDDRAVAIDRAESSSLATAASRSHRKDKRAASAIPSLEAGGVARRRGRHANRQRRDAIRNAINKHGNQWREHLDEIFSELDTQQVALGNFCGKPIDLGECKSATVLSWADLGLAEGEQRSQIVDALRKYPD